MALTAKELVTTWENALSIFRRTSPATYLVENANNLRKKYQISFGIPFSLNTRNYKVVRDSLCDP
ncbi:hypothetical protein CGCF415_v013075 [Colletotrichum fructicola]|nr:hypothetical protein CGCF415_v013075 [Colletotrichum fructicola]KAF4897671.1 hypothetical protein CGCFRS4_v004846 [Colletotrichum fructicola]KAF4927524.1 hypothetical protein CGCF245_v013133 [Colletotrichum fructicola]